jgi:hypothetical protein
VFEYQPQREMERQGEREGGRDRETGTEGDERERSDGD